MIDIINDETFVYSAGASDVRGGFSKTIDYTWIPLKKEQRVCKKEK